MAKKIALGIMATIIVVFFGLSAYKSFFGQEKEPEKPKVDIFKNAMEKVDVSYVPYGESNGDCLLFVTNNNKFQINVAGTIVKEDENGVHDEDKDDEINININPQQTYVMETVNPNNKGARESRQEITFDASSLKASQVEGSNEDGKKSTELLFQDDVNVQIFPDKRNDSEQPLITIENNTNHKLYVQGYVVFYGDKEQTEITNIAKIEFEDVPKKDVYKDYIYIGTSEEASDNFKIFINMCE